VMSHNLALAGFMVSLVVSMLPASGNAAEVSKLWVASSAISDGGNIPSQFTCSGADQSPPLSWGGIPHGTQSMALLLDDPDAPGGTFVHWVVYDISPSLSGFKSGAAEGSAGANSIGKASYMGPCPPPGNQHHYHFRLFALDTDLRLAPSPNAQTVLDAISGHVLESAELVGIFER
jgi:Raf kinase inhibitor-like YbhB/YbcL family protein